MRKCSIVGISYAFRKDTILKTNVRNDKYIRYVETRAERNNAMQILIIYAYAVLLEYHMPFQGMQFRKQTRQMRNIIRYVPTKA